MEDSDGAEYRVVREYLCRLLHDANTGKICPDDSDPTKYGAMADAILGQTEYVLVKRSEYDELAHEVMRHQVGQSYEVGHEHGVLAGLDFAIGKLAEARKRTAPGDGDAAL